MNMFDRFQRDPLGFDDYNAWMRHHEKLHAQFPLGCAKVGEEWLALWEALGELLKMPAVVETRVRKEWHNCVRQTFTCAEAFRVAEMLCGADEHHGFRVARRRVVLLDGTLIKELGPR